MALKEKIRFADIKKMIGNWAVDITGNVTGNVAGNVVGDVTGNVVGNTTGNHIGGILETAGAVTADGAITIPATSKSFFITKAGVAAMTLANPTSTTHDGLRLTFIATTAHAHTLSNAAGAGFNNAAASGDIGTFGGAVGDNIVIEAYQGKWYVVSSVNVTLA